ncbi:MAG: hypothetical protein R3217_00400 [Gammaproteobacteria bacterium]|nr:hypothetical protein [Gammaproteobacteria bacterium]
MNSRTRNNTVSFTTAVLVGIGLATSPAALAGHHDHDEVHYDFDNNNVCDDRLEKATGHNSVTFDFDNGDLYIDIDHEEMLIITADDDVIYKGKSLELTARGRELAGDYRRVFRRVQDDVFDLVGDATAFGISTATEAIVSVFTGADMDEFEAKTEEKAAELEAQAEKMCERVLEIEPIEAEMAREIDGFQPVIFMPKDVI